MPDAFRLVTTAGPSAVPVWPVDACAPMMCSWGVAAHSDAASLGPAQSLGEATFDKSVTF